jgi:hypothetical protein
MRKTGGGCGAAGTFVIGICAGIGVAIGIGVCIGAGIMTDGPTIPTSKDGARGA